MRISIAAIFTIFILTATGQGFRVRHYLPGTQNNTAKAIFETTPVIISPGVLWLRMEVIASV